MMCFFIRWGFNYLSLAFCFQNGQGPSFQSFWLKVMTISWVLIMLCLLSLQSAFLWHARQCCFLISSLVLQHLYRKCTQERNLVRFFVCFILKPLIMLTDLKICLENSPSLERNNSCTLTYKATQKSLAFREGFCPGFDFNGLKFYL